MTFTILGRNPENGELGIGIATYSLAVGATCPKLLPGIGVATSQASTNPAIAEEMMELLEDGTEPAAAFVQALANDQHPEFRQLALLTITSDPFVHSGSNIKPHSGHISGTDCVAVGNFLANDRVLTAMVEGFSNPDSDMTNGDPIQNPPTLAERLLAALGAGKISGGQSGSDGAHLPERSAALLVATPTAKFPIDLRIDVSREAIPALRAAYKTYLPMHNYYLQRAENPTTLPSQDDWVKNLNR
jgi:uncharacterized Ntn-hydrolase superfamily protein